MISLDKTFIPTGSILPVLYRPLGVVLSGKVGVLTDLISLNFVADDLFSSAELGCPVIFEAKLEKVSERVPDDRLNSLISNVSKQDKKYDFLFLLISLSL